MKYKSRVTAITVLPDGESIFSEQATILAVEEEGAGEYISITQCNGHCDGGQKIAFDPGQEWEQVKAAFDRLTEEAKA